MLFPKFDICLDFSSAGSGGPDRLVSDQSGGPDEEPQRVPRALDLLHSNNTMLKPKVPEQSNRRSVSSGFNSQEVYKLFQRQNWSFLEPFPTRMVPCGMD